MEESEGHPFQESPLRHRLLRSHKFSELSWLLDPLLLGSLYFFLYFLMVGIFSKSLWGEEEEFGGEGGIWYANIKSIQYHRISHSIRSSLIAGISTGAIPSPHSWPSEPRAQIPNPANGSRLNHHHRVIKLVPLSQSRIHINPEIHIGLSSEH